MKTGPLAIHFVVACMGLASVPSFAVGPSNTSSSARDKAALARWIGSLQFQNPSLPSYGAIQIDRGPGYRAPDGTAYYQISPYDANLAIVGLLCVGDTSSRKVAGRWISWYLAHIGHNGAGRGEIFDTWYLKDGNGETTAPPGVAADRQNHIDATDSAAATFLQCVLADDQAGGRANLLQMPHLKSRLEEIADVIHSLQQPDGLTWAKRSYPVEYTMDNCEAYLGLRSMALIENDLFKDHTASARYESAGERVRMAIVHTLYDPANHLFYVARFEEGKFDPARLTTWYPDTVAQVWPALFDVIDASDPITRSAFAALDSTWNGKQSPNWTDSQVDPGGFTWPSIAYAALIGGDAKRGQARILYLRERVFPKGSNGPSVSEPFTVSDAGWLIADLSRIKTPH